MSDKPPRAAAIRNQRNADTSAVSLHPATAREPESAYRLMRDNMQCHLREGDIPTLQYCPTLIQVSQRVIPGSAR